MLTPSRHSSWRPSSARVPSGLISAGAHISASSVSCSSTASSPCSAATGSRHSCERCVPSGSRVETVASTHVPSGATVY